MQRLSTNLTLFLKIFIPLGWTTFFGLFAIVMFIVDNNDNPVLGNSTFRMYYLLFFILFLAFLYFTIFQLKRVEADDKSIVVTNYFQTVRYSFDSIKTISETNLGIAKLVRIKLFQKGIYGKAIPFIAKNANLKEFKNANPGLFSTAK
ncbi:MAG: hypothetical protein V3V14_08920 [Saprospiraceae bacterium]